MASNQNHKALDPLIANEHKHQPHLVSLLDSPTLLNEPWKPSGIVDTDEMQEIVGSHSSGAELSLTSSHHDSRAYRYFRERVLSIMVCKFAFTHTRPEVGSFMRGVCLVSGMARSPLPKGRLAMPEKDNLPFLVQNAFGAEVRPEIEDGKDSAAR